MSHDTIAVIGMGYVGIPVAVSFARAGHTVIGINRSRPKVDLINEGVCPLKGDEPNLAAYLHEAVENDMLTATQDFARIKDAKAILVAVQTPFAGDVPDYSALISALENIGKHLGKGQLVVIESTIAPGTMEGVVRPTLERESGLTAGDDFLLGNCPERVMPGKLLYNIEHLDRVVGGIDEASQDAIVTLYSSILKGNVYKTDCVTAEVVKTAENAYRDVEIAFANELALLCESLGIDVYTVRELVNKSPYRNVHLPGTGVGGHCLPKDSLLLQYGSKGVPLDLMMLARDINKRMPHHTVELVRKAIGDVGGKRIAVLGLSYLEDTDDVRNSPTLDLVSELEKLGAAVMVHDPYVESYPGIALSSDLDEVVTGAHCVVISTAHSEYASLDLDTLNQKMAQAAIVDGRNAIDKETAQAKGFVYYGIGK